jgi:hypothetical protein
MRTVAIPDYRSTPGNKGAYALRRMEGNTAHFLMITFWESEEAIRAFAGEDISVAKNYEFDKEFLLELEPCSVIRDRCCNITTSRVRPMSANALIASTIERRGPKTTVKFM